MKNEKYKKNNLAIPGEPMNEQEFRLIIQEAEKSSFAPITHIKKEVLSAWKKKYAK